MMQEQSKNDNCRRFTLFWHWFRHGNLHSFFMTAQIFGKQVKSIPRYASE